MPDTSSDVGFDVRLTALLWPRLFGFFADPNPLHYWRRTALECETARIMCLLAMHSDEWGLHPSIVEWPATIAISGTILHGRGDMPEKAGGKLKIEVTARRDYVPVQSFLTVLANTLRILRNIDLGTSPDGRRTARWKIAAASLRSPLMITLVGQAKSEDRVGEIGQAYLHGLEMIEQDPIDAPPYFNSDSLQRAKKLVSVLNDGVSRVKMSGFGHTVEATQKIAAKVDALTAPRLRSYGSIEGKLETATVRGAPRFFINDTLTNETVQCFFDESRLEAILFT